jgi:Na+-driven multidrug efflux pump
LFVVVAVLGAWAVLFLTQDLIVRTLSVQGEAADLIRPFCTFIAGSFLFTGALFVANAAFNNLGFPLLSTLFNWGRATIGTIPLVLLARPWGAAGVMVGAAGGSLVFGLAAVVVAFGVVRRLNIQHVNRTGSDPLIPSGAETAALAPTTRTSG